VIDLATLPGSPVDLPVYRVVSARYPQVNLFERVADPRDWGLLYQVESLTNPRLRDEAGNIRLVPLADRVSGEGASWIMAPFTHPPADGRGGRFNRDFGVWYCAAEEAVAIAESAFHRQRFLRESRIKAATLEMRLLRAWLGPATLHDLRQLAGHAIYDPDDYGAGQALGRELRAAGSNGLHYLSVRMAGECFGVLRPRVLSGAGHWRYLRYVVGERGVEVGEG